jgi:hypothetical protein
MLFTVFRMLSLTVAYLLMLIAMEYYYGHLIAIILGFTFGNYLFDTSVGRLENEIRNTARMNNKPVSDRPGTSASLGYGTIVSM